MSLKRIIMAVVAALVVLSGGSRADAYPYFQLTTGTKRCNACHFSPGGGGLINDYGRDAASTDISMAGNGDFLHGLWYPPDWLALGMDYRGAAIWKNDKLEGSRTAVFPMQFDLYANAKLADRISFSFIGGFRGQARTTENDSVIKRLVSREHFITWKPRTKNKYYVRVGRFFAPYGLRLPDHTTYVRRYLGFHTLEETYNLSFGSVTNEREYHATLYAPTPSFLGAGAKRYGAAGYYERRVHDSKAAWAAQVKLGFSADDAVYMVGGVGKWWLENIKVLLLGEVDAGMQTFDIDGADARPQLTTYLGATYMPLQGLMLTGAVERYDEDLNIKGTSRNAATLMLQVFPYAHFEVLLLGKLETQGKTFSKPARLGMLQLHYYL